MTELWLGIAAAVVGGGIGLVIRSARKAERGPFAIAAAGTLGVAFGCLVIVMLAVLVVVSLAAPIR